LTQNMNADLKRLEAELAALENAHDFENGTDPRIERLIERIAEISIELDGPYSAALAPPPRRRVVSNWGDSDRSERRRVQRAAERRRRAARTRKVRRCKYCGKKIPPEADHRRKFCRDEHRDAYHNEKKGTAPTTADTLHVSANGKPHEQAVSEGSENEFCKTREGE